MVIQTWIRFKPMTKLKKVRDLALVHYMTCVPVFSLKISTKSWALNQLKTSAPRRSLVGSLASKSKFKTALLWGRTLWKNGRERESECVCVCKCVCASVLVYASACVRECVGECLREGGERARHSSSSSNRFLFAFWWPTEMVRCIVRAASISWVVLQNNQLLAKEQLA